MQLTQAELSGHLPETIAANLLAALPESVQNCIEREAQATGFPSWFILETAISSYLDPDATSFKDFDPTMNQPCRD
ncbi:hypothetical protein IQ250_10520 [Pseudanabaenaceae cyanobacterium LEGE 13415]|nr:hypothetical protein [Pseudanabaenaceae cyanobacterium LEGE 13415]